MLITHRLEELDLIADAVTVLRDGRHVATRPASELSRAEIVRMMVGRPIETLFAERKAKTPGREVLRVDGLGLEGVFSNVSFSLRAGEIVGMAGLVGAGRSEIAQACFGLTPPTSGKVTLDGRAGHSAKPETDALARARLSPRGSRRRRPDHVVFDRQQRHSADRRPAGPAGRRRRSPPNCSVATEAVKTYDVRTTGVDQLVSDLSGGNRQKVAFAKWLSTKPKVLILDEPTHGIDVGSKAQVHRMIARLAEDGLAVLVISSDLPEVLAISDRILVVSEGEIVAELDPATRGPDGRHDGRHAKRAGACRCPLTLARCLRKPRNDPSASSRCASA